METPSNAKTVTAAVTATVDGVPVRFTSKVSTDADIYSLAASAVDSVTSEARLWAFKRQRDTYGFGENKQSTLVLAVDIDGTAKEFAACTDSDINPFTAAHRLFGGLSGTAYDWIREQRTQAAAEKRTQVAAEEQAVNGATPRVRVPQFNGKRSVAARIANGVIETLGALVLIGIGVFGTLLVLGYLPPR